MRQPPHVSDRALRLPKPPPALPQNQHLIDAIGVERNATYAAHPLHAIGSGRNAFTRLFQGETPWTAVQQAVAAHAAIPDADHAARAASIATIRERTQAWRAHHRIGARGREPLADHERIKAHAVDDLHEQLRVSEMRNQVQAYAAQPAGNVAERMHSIGTIRSTVADWHRVHATANRRAAFSPAERATSASLDALKSAADKHREHLLDVPPQDAHFPDVLHIPTADGGARTVRAQNTGESFYRLDPRQAAREAYVYHSQVADRPAGGKAVDASLAPHLNAYLSGDLALHRGVNRYHPAWNALAEQSLVSPLGRDPMPDTSTKRTNFVPFTPDLPTARGFAMAPHSGFDPADDVRNVSGYSTKDPHFAYGMTASVGVGRRDAIGFINASEIQLRGPVRAPQTKTYLMGTHLREVYPTAFGPESTETIGSHRAPEAYTAAERIGQPVRDTRPGPVETASRKRIQNLL